MAAPSEVDGTAVETIHALSSGAPPAAIAVVRLSGPDAGIILARMAGALPEARRASLRTLRDDDGDVLDRALIMWFPGPATVTGEDLAELHVHGGRAVVGAILLALKRAGSRLAQPGEFTRRGLLNGRLDLADVEGLADLLGAETEYQRREALRRADGALGRRLKGWSDALLSLAARLEVAIDYDGDVELEDEAALRPDIQRLTAEIGQALARVSAERVRDGLRVVITGPVNAGKSSLFNALVGSDAAIVSPLAGTTRDLIERPVAISGMPFVLIDTAGLRDGGDEIERIGIERALRLRGEADILIDIEGGEAARPNVIEVTTMIDIRAAKPGTIGTSAITGEGIDHLLAAVAHVGAGLLPQVGEVALNEMYRGNLAKLVVDLRQALATDDLIIAAEFLRHARETLDRLTGGTGFEDMLDALFGRFCLGK